MQSQNILIYYINLFLSAFACYIQKYANLFFSQERPRAFHACFTIHGLAFVHTRRFDIEFVSKTCVESNAKSASWIYSKVVADRTMQSTCKLPR